MSTPTPTDKQLKILKKHLPEIATMSVTTCRFDGRDIGQQLIREADELSDEVDEDSLKKSVRHRKKNFKNLKRDFEKAVKSAEKNMKTTAQRNMNEDYYAPCEVSHCNVCSEDNQTKQASIRHKERFHPAHTHYCQFGDCGCIYENEDEERIHLERHD